MITDDEYTNLKRRLTFRINNLRKVKNAGPENIEKAARQVVAECKYALSLFASKGYPDDHHRWERAKYDAEMTIRMGRVSI